MSDDATEVPGEASDAAPSGPTKLKLREPIHFGKDLIEELTVKPTSRAFKEYALPMKDDGTIMFQPYTLASVGVRMAGHPNALVDKLSVGDMMALARVVMSFFG